MTMSRSTPLQRSKPLARSGRLKRKGSGPALAFPKPERPKGTSYSRRPRETGRMVFYKSLPCDVRQVVWLTFGNSIGDCEGETQAMHLGEHGLSNKCDDQYTGPGCRGHHDDLDGRSGRLKRLWWTSLTKTEQLLVKFHLVTRAKRQWDALTDGERARWNARANNREAA